LGESLSGLVVGAARLFGRSVARHWLCLRRFDRIVANSEVIWCDPVNIFESLGWFLFLHLPFRGQGQPRPWQVMATIDQADIRGSEPHNHDPSGAASD
jgi:hypothetical protein